VGGAGAGAGAGGGVLPAGAGREAGANSGCRGWLPSARGRSLPLARVTLTRLAPSLPRAPREEAVRLWLVPTDAAHGSRLVGTPVSSGHGNGRNADTRVRARGAAAAPGFLPATPCQRGKDTPSRRPPSSTSSCPLPRPAAPLPPPPPSDPKRSSCRATRCAPTSTWRSRWRTT
jgi:hypothetical protein